MTTRTSPTAGELQAAEQEVNEAEQALAAEKRLIDMGTQHGFGPWTAAKARYERAVASLAHLQVRLQDAENARTERRAAEKKHAKSLAERARTLQAGRERITAALAAAQDVLADVLDAVGDHNAQLAEFAGEMAAQGFTPIASEFESGADPRERVVQLGGEFWREIDFNALLNLLTFRIGLARTDPGSFAIVMKRAGEGHMAKKTVADLLAQVAPLELAEPVRRTVWKRAEVGPSLVGISEYRREQVQRDLEEQRRMFARKS